MQNDAAGMHKPPIVLDGAMGTELERRGLALPLPLWSAAAVVEQPGMVWEIHQDYVRAGADMLTAATFRTTRYALAGTGLAKRAEELTHQAVRLAQSAASTCDCGVRVAGSLAPLEDCFRPEDAPDDETMRIEHAWTAQTLAAADVDLILLETHNSAREVLIAARAALDTGKPVWVSLMPRSATDIYNGDSLLDTARELAQMGVQAVLVNCCPMAVAETAFLALRQALPEMLLGAYPNLSQAGGKPWEYKEVSVEDYEQWVLRMTEEGVGIIGGCCGTTPEHIAGFTHARKKG